LEIKLKPIHAGFEIKYFKSISNYNKKLNKHHLLNIFGVNATTYGSAFPSLNNQSKSVEFDTKCKVPTFPNLEAIKLKKL